MSARFIVDECCPRLFADALALAGYDVDYVVDKWPGISDCDVAARARRTQAIIVTQDYDFGDLVFRAGLDIPGIVIVACSGIPIALRANRLAAVAAHLDDRLADRLTIVEPRRIRQRAIKAPR